VDGKINWILDFVAPTDETIKECEKHKAFSEKASFVVMKLGEKWEKVDSFDGSFIDALKYIKEHFDDRR